MTKYGADAVCASWGLASVYFQFMGYFTLWAIYDNICQASKLFDFIIYADDTSLSATLEIILKNGNSTSIQNTINNELVNINDWLNLNKLSLNIQKTKYMIFHTPQKKYPHFKLK